MLRTNRYRATEVKEEPVAVTNNKELLKAITEKRNMITNQLIMNKLK